MGVSTWEHDARDHRAIWQTAALTLRARSFFFFFSPARILFRSTSAGGAVGAAVRKCE